MTRVEELRGQIIDMAQGVSFADISTFLHLLDDLHAEGVAEGAEQEAAKIVHCGECQYGLFDGEEGHDYYRECIVAAGKPHRIVDTNGYCEAGLARPASVLAPPDEASENRSWLHLAHTKEKP